MITYVDACPSCGGDITDKEAISCGVCNKCYHQGRFPFLKEKEKYVEFLRFFERFQGRPPWDLQKSWIKSFVLGRSFPIVAPTGMGKTTFGIIASCFYVREKDKKAYIILPTKILVLEVAARFEKIDEDVNILAYTGKKGEKDKILKGNFSILITTGKFFLKNIDLLSSLKIGFFFVDDADSMIRSYKAISGIKQMSYPDTILVFSSTTLRPKGKIVSDFIENFGFLPGGTPVPIRNIVDIALPMDMGLLKEILKKMGKGALLFFPRGKREEMRDTIEFLKQEGFSIEIFEEPSQLERFKNKELHFLSDIASPYGRLVRGIDIPETIRYVVFYGIPSFEFSMENVFSMVIFLRAVERIVKDGGLSILLDKLFKQKQDKWDILREEIERYVMKYKSQEVMQKLSQRADIIIQDNTILLPDPITYIQASGRASRIYKGKLTKGASFVFSPNETFIRALKKSISYRFGEDIEFKKSDGIDLLKLSCEIDESRARGEEIGSVKKALLVVESPTKARTIAHFFGTPVVKNVKGIIFYEVFTGEEVLTITASKGHLYELTTDLKKIDIDNKCFYGICRNGGYNGYFEYIRKCLACNRQFAHKIDKCTFCESDIISQEKLVQILREEVFLSDEVLLATDPDREGEKISYDLFNALQLSGLKLRRIELHEITKKEFVKAKNNTRETSLPLVNGYIFRRYEDRWIGFSLSNILIKRFQKANLSAGRVQSPVLGWIVQRWKESREKRKIIIFDFFGQKITIDEEKLSISEIPKEIEIPLVKKKESKKLSPSSPFDTPSILSFVNRFLHLPANETMRIMQDLFTHGFITYHRTDAKYISKKGRNIAKSYLEMIGKEELYFPRSWGTPGTHEGIRPTRPLDTEELKRTIKRTKREVHFTKKHFFVYDIIFRRFIASQMKDAVILVQCVLALSPWKDKIEIERPIEVLDKGFIEVVPIKIYKEVEDDKIKISLNTKKVPRAFPCTQAEIIDKMKEEGIGRPSTYVRTIKILLDRYFIIQRGKMGYLIPTALGREVYSFIKENYSEVFSLEKTREMEKTIDKIVEGELSLDNALDKVWDEVRAIISLVDVAR